MDVSAEEIYVAANVTTAAVIAFIWMAPDRPYVLVMAHNT